MAAGDSGTEAGPQEALPPTWAVENASVIRSGTQVIGAPTDARITVDDPRLRSVTRASSKPSMRRGALAQHVDLTVTEPDRETLVTEGMAAHRVSGELNEVARANTLDKSRSRTSLGFKIRRVGVCFTAVLFVASLAWIAGNIAGYFTSAGEDLDVTKHGITSSVVVDGATENVDCFSDGSQNVWAAAPPFNNVVPYRCGDAGLAVAIPGPISAGVAGIALASLVVLALAGRRRHRRKAWY
jgi:hypothetical protein